MTELKFKKDDKLVRRGDGVGRVVRQIGYEVELPDGRREFLSQKYIEGHYVLEPVLEPHKYAVGDHLIPTDEDECSYSWEVIELTRDPDGTPTYTLRDTDERPSNNYGVAEGDKARVLQLAKRGKWVKA